MRKTGKLWSIFILLTVFLSGCRNANTAEPAQPVLVGKIEVNYSSYDINLQRTYTATDKIDTVLFFLYGLSPAGRVEEDPELMAEQRCQITVILSNDDSLTYRLRGGQYLSVNCNPWQKIDSRKASWLFPMLVSMPGDV